MGTYGMDGGIGEGRQHEHAGNHGGNLEPAAIMGRGEMLLFKALPLSIHIGLGDVGQGALGGSQSFQHFVIKHGSQLLVGVTLGMLVHVEQETDFIVLFHNVYCFELLK